MQDLILQFNKLFIHCTVYYYRKQRTALSECTSRDDWTLGRIELYACGWCVAERAHDM